MSLRVESTIHRHLWTLDRPTVHNAVDEATLAALERALDGLDERADRRPIVLTGAGDRTFCAGGDLTWFSELDEEGADRMAARVGGVLDRLYRGPRVVIAAIRGDVWGGGCEVLTASHLRVAARGARLAFRQARLGVTTGWGGTRRLFEAIGRSHALELLLTSEEVSMERAAEIGLVHRVVDSEEVPEVAERWAVRVSGQVPAAVAGFLELAAAPSETLERREAELFRELWRGPGFRETLSRWRGRSDRAGRGSRTDFRSGDSGAVADRVPAGDPDDARDR